LGLSIVEISRRLALIQEANIRGVAVVQQGQTLRDIAREFDMSPDSWTLIAEYNGFTSSVVPAGTVVRVPANTGAERG
jgi:LysM repeat protein